MGSRGPRKDLTTILVYGLPLGTLEEKLEERFQEFGTIFEIRIVKKDDGKKVFARISYEDNNDDILNRILEGNPSRNLDFKDSKNRPVMLNVKILGSFPEDDEEEQRRKIFVNDLPTQREVPLEESNIKDVFAPFGKIEEGSTRIVRISNKGERRVVFYATLVFEKEESVRKVLDRQEDKRFDILGHYVNVQSADKKKKGAIEKQYPWGQDTYSYPASHMLFAQKIPLWVTEGTLKEAFSKFGSVESVEICKKEIHQQVHDHDDEWNNGRKQKFRAFGFITFVDEEAVHKACMSGKSVIIPMCDRDQLIPFRKFFPRGQSADRNNHFDQWPNMHQKTRPFVESLPEKFQRPRSSNPAPKSETAVISTLRHRNNTNQSPSSAISTAAVRSSGNKPLSPAVSTALVTTSSNETTSSVISTAVVRTSTHQLPSSVISTEAVRPRTNQRVSSLRSAGTAQDMRSFMQSQVSSAVPRQQLFSFPYDTPGGASSGSLPSDIEKPRSPSQEKNLTGNVSSVNTQTRRVVNSQTNWHAPVSSRDATSTAIRNLITGPSTQARSTDTTISGAAVSSRMSSAHIANYIRDLDRFAGLEAAKTPIRPPLKSARRKLGCCTLF